MEVIESERVVVKSGKLLKVEVEVLIIVGTWVVVKGGGENLTVEMGLSEVDE